MSESSPRANASFNVSASAAFAEAPSLGLRVGTRALKTPRGLCLSAASSSRPSMSAAGSSPRCRARGTRATDARPRPCTNLAGELPHALPRSAWHGSSNRLNIAAHPVDFGLASKHASVATCRTALLVRSVLHLSLMPAPQPARLECARGASGHAAAPASVRRYRNCLEVVVEPAPAIRLRARHAPPGICAFESDWSTTQGAATSW